MRLALVFFALYATSSSTHIVFVVDKVQEVSKPDGSGVVASEHHTAPVVMAEFAKRCPEVSFTKVRENADLTLETQSGASILSDAKGNVVYTSPAKSLSNMVKDVCRYIGTH
jgi:hypothetical protein